MAAARCKRLALTCCWLLALGGGQAAAQGVGDTAFRARGGMSYFQDFAGSQVGGLYGLDLAAPVADQASLFGSFTHNHFGQGSQFLGTLGGFRQGAAEGELVDRLSGGVLLDQYTDTRFDGLYLSQFRYFAGLTLSENLAAGITYTDPLEASDNITLASLGPGVTTLRNAEIVEGYLAMNLGATTLTAALGQRQAPSRFVASFHARREIGPRLSLYSSSSFAENRLWAATIGLEWSLGPGSPHGAMHLGTNSSPPPMRDVMVRAQNGPGPTSPFADPSLGHNLNYDAQRLGSMLTSAPFGGAAAASLPTATTEGQGEGNAEEEPTFYVELDYTSPPGF